VDKRQALPWTAGYQGRIAQPVESIRDRLRGEMHIGSIAASRACDGRGQGSMFRPAPAGSA